MLSLSPALAGRAALWSACTPQRAESRINSMTSAVPQESLLHASVLTLPSSPDALELVELKGKPRREGKGYG